MHCHSIFLASQKKMVLPADDRNVWVFGTSAIRRMAGEALKDIDDEDSARSKGCDC